MPVKIHHHEHRSFSVFIALGILRFRYVFKRCACVSLQSRLSRNEHSFPIRLHIKQYQPDTVEITSWALDMFAGMYISVVFDEAFAIWAGHLQANVLRWGCKALNVSHKRYLLPLPVSLKALRDIPNISGCMDGYKKASQLEDIIQDSDTRTSLQSKSPNETQTSK